MKIGINSLKIILLRLHSGAAAIVSATLALLVAGGTARAQVGTAFTYQGRLMDHGGAANGSYDFRFRLASDPQGLNYIGVPVLTNGLAVAGGLFTVAIDFGAVFNGANY